MIKKALVLAVAAVSLTSGAAFAQSSDYRYDRHDGDQRTSRYDHRDNNDRNDHNDRYDRRDNRQAQNSDWRDNRGHDYDGRRDHYEGRGDGYRDNGYRSNGYGYQQRYQMRSGERLSQYYRGDQYVVTDWRSNRLYEPQRGYHWVRSGNDYALVAIATGLIVNVLLNH